MKHLVACLLAVLVVSTLAFGQENYVNRYDVFTGFSYLQTSTLNLNQRGFNGSAGVNVNRWLGLGGDFSVFTGSTGLSVLDTKLAPLFTPFVPARVLAGVTVPIDTTTYTFAAGPQLNLRKVQKVTFFVRPGLGVFHESVGVNLTVLGPLASLLASVPGLSSKMSDTSFFYGGGGGLDINASRHVGLRLSADFVRAHLFSSLLPVQNNLRLSIGPTWKWGEVK